MEEKIYRIIAAELAGEALSPQDRILLEKWLSLSLRNKQVYDKYKIWYGSWAVFRRKKGIDREAAWKKIRERRQKIAGIEKRNRFLRNSGIAAGFMLLIGLTALWQWKNSGTDFRNDRRLAENQPPEIQIQLELPGGERIALTGATDSVKVSESGRQALCDSSGLTYFADTSLHRDEPVVYNKLLVPAGAEYHLLLSDGTRVFMNAASELRYPTVFPPEKREVFLTGEAYFEVSPDTLRAFTVKTAAMDIRVLGTSFNVNAYEDVPVVTATLVSGKIRAKCRNQDYDLQPGQQIRTHRTTGSVQVEEVNTALFTSWKNGYYYFEARPLKEIMQIFSRWYGFKVIFRHPWLEELEFSGRMQRYEKVERLLRKFEQTGKVRFVYNGDTVTVKEK